MPANQVELRAEPRTVLGKHVRRLRREGVVPANIFGHGDSVAIQAPARALEHLIAHGGRTALISIALDGDEPRTALLKRLQRDPRSGQLLHVDFQAVSLNQMVTATVPLRFHGEAPGAARSGGLVAHPVTEVHVEALARNLPDHVEVDLSRLEDLHAAIHVGDLHAPGNVRLIDPPETVVAVVLPPKVEVEELPPTAEEAPAAAAAPEGAPEAAAEPEAPEEAPEA